MNRRRVETPSMNGDAEADYVLAEQELGKLHREYRILKGQRRSYLEESQNIIRKQNGHIKSLKDERSEMDMDLRLATSTKVCGKDGIDEGLMKTLLQNYIEYKTLCLREKEEIRVLDKQARIFGGAQRKYRMETTGRSEMIRYQLNTPKRTRVMENRLYLSTVTFNKALRKNSDLRDRIEELKREGRLYDGLYRKMCSEQNDLKVEMNDIIQQSTSAYDSGDEAQNKMAALLERNEKDQNIFNVEIKCLQRIVDHEKKLKTFMNVKAQDRADHLKATNEELQRRKQTHGHVDPDETNICTLELSFIRLRAATGEADLDKLVRQFIYREGLNFALFNYINEVNDDIELLQEEIKNTENIMKNFKSQGITLAGERLNIVKRLEAKANSVTKTANGLEGNVKKVRKRLHHLMSAVASIVRKLGCDQSRVASRLGGRDGITAFDAMAYLGLIEQTMNHLLLIEKCREHKISTMPKPDDKPGGNQDGPKTAGSVIMPRREPVQTVEITINPPTIRDEVDIVECSSSAEVLNTTDQPLTLEQVKRKVTRRLQRLEAQQSRTKSGRKPSQPKAIQKSTDESQNGTSA